MQHYRVKSHLIPGTTYSEIEKNALKFYKKVISNSKRMPYVRSKYFDNKKVFLSLFWRHLHDKNRWDRQRRLVFFEMALELIRDTNCKPTIKENPNDKSELLYRFSGETFKGVIFYVQIKEDKITQRKWLMSIFPN